MSWPVSASEALCDGTRFVVPGRYWETRDCHSRLFSVQCILLVAHSWNKIVVSGSNKNRRTGTLAFRALDLLTKTIWYVFILFLRRKLARARPCHSEGQGKVGWDCTDNYLGSRPAALINILMLKGGRAVAYHFV